MKKIILSTLAALIIPLTGNATTLEFGSATTVLANATNPSADASASAVLLDGFDVAGSSSADIFLAFALNGNSAGTDVLAGPGDAALGWIGNGGSSVSSGTLARDDGEEISLTSFAFAYQHAAGSSTLDFTFTGKRDGASVGTKVLSSPAHNTAIAVDFTTPTTGSFVNIDEIVISPASAIFGGFVVDTLVYGAASANNIPTASSFTATLTQNSVYPFATASFNYDDGDDDVLDHIRVATIPGNGTLYVDANDNDTYDNGEALSNGDSVSKANLDAGNLQYYNTDGTSSSFTFDVNDGAAYGASTYTTTLTVSPPLFVTSIVRQTPTDERTDADQVIFRVTFTYPVENVDSSDFSLNGTAAGDGTVGTVTAISTSIYDVTITGVTSSNGTINLDIKGNGGVSGSNDIAKVVGTSISQTAKSGVITRSEFGQSFTASGTGSFTDVTLYINAAATYSGAATMELRSGEGLSGAILATEAITIVDEASDYQQKFTFTTPATVTSGEVYTIRFTGAGAFSTGYTVDATTGDPLAGGVLYQPTALVGADLTFDATIATGPAALLSTTAPSTDETYTITDNDAPTAASFTATPVQSSVYTLTTAGFNYADGNDEPLDHIRVTAIPGNGTLYVDANDDDTYDAGEELSNGDSVSKANLDAGNLQYYNTDGTSSSFTFDVNDGIEYSASTYTVTLTVSPPLLITSIVRLTPSDAATDADQVIFRVTFSDDVTNVDTSDFALSGTSAGDGTVSSVSAVSASIYDVTVTGLTSSNGTVNLDIKGNGGVSGSNNIAELVGSAVSQTTTGNTIAQPEIGQSFTAPFSGSFLDVTFYMNVAATYSGAGTLELRSGEGLSGSVLATQAVTFVDEGTAYQQKFTFSSPAAVTSGSVYTIRIAGDFGTSLTFDAKTGDPLAGGIIYIPTALASADLTFEATISTGGATTLSTAAPATDESYTISNNAAPTAANFTATPTQNAVYTFATANFSYADGDSDALDHLRVTAIPGNGTLYVDVNDNDTYDAGEELSNGDTVSKANLDSENLQYYNTDGTSSSFTFDVNDGTGYSASTYTATLTVSPPLLVTSIVRLTPTAAMTDADQVIFRVTFSHPAENVDTSDFSLNGTSAGDGTVSTVSAVSTSIYDVTVTGLTSSNGTVNLDIKGNGGVAGSNDITKIVGSSISQTAKSGVITRSEFGQSFTASGTGSFTDVTLYVNAAATYSGSATMELRSGEGLSGSVLATQAITVVDEASDYQQKFTFTTPATVTTGTVYTIRFTGPGAFSTGYTVDATTGDPLAGGVLYQPTALVGADLTFDATIVTGPAAALSAAAPATDESYAIANNELPTAANFAATPTQNSVYTFTTAHFSYADGDSNPINLLRVTAIPANGTLYVDVNDNDAYDNGEELSNGASVSKANLDSGNLQYYNTDGTSSSFTFDVNDGTSYSASTYTVTLTVDVLPVITSVSVPANATYVAGQNLDFTVNASESVVVNTAGGTPQLALTIGATTRQASYMSGSGSSAALFRYTIQSGDADNNGVAIGVLSVNGGTLRDATNNDLNATLNNVGATTAVLVDAAAPTITSITVPANATYIAGQNLDFTVNANENVVVNTAGGTPQLALTIGSTTRQATYLSGSGSGALLFRYTVQTGENDSDGIAIGALSANGGTLRDAASNNLDVTLNNVGATTAVLVDAAAPTITSVTVPANATYITGQNLDFTVNVDENVTVNTAGGTPQIALTIGATTRQATYVSGSGSSALLFRYTVQTGESDTDGISIGALSVNGGTLRDAASNNLNVTLNNVGATTAVLVDAVAPTVTSVTVPANATYIAGQNLDFTVNLDENVTVNTAGGTPQIALTIGATTRQATYVSGSGTNALLLRYTVQTGEIDSDGIAIGALSANGGTLRDAASNDLNVTLNNVGATTAVLVDAAAPTVTSVTVPANATYIAGQNLDFTVNADESVTVDTAGGTPQIALTIGTTTRQAVYVSGSGTSALLFRYTVQAGEIDSDGIAVGVLSANGGTLRDAVSNDAILTLNNVGSLASVFVDAQAPTVAEFTAVVTPGNDNTPNVTLSTDEAGSLSIGGSCGSASEGAVSSGNTTITLTQGDNSTGLTDGTYTDCTATVTDSAGNASDVVTLASFTIDTVASTGHAVSFNDATINATEATSQSFTFSDAEVGSTYGYTINSTGGGTNVTGNGTIATATDVVSSIDLSGLEDGTLTLSVVLTDAAGNAATAVTAETLLDKTAPSGHSVVFDDTLIDATDAASTSFSFANAEIGSTYSYTLSSSYGGTNVTGNGTLATAADVVNGINVSGLNDGTLTLSAVLTDVAGNAAAAVTHTTTKDTRSAQTLTFAEPNAQSFGSAPTLSATAGSNLAVSFSSSTTDVCTVTDEGVLTFVGVGTCTVTAMQAGDNSDWLAATAVSQSFEVTAVAPAAPIMGTVIKGNGQAVISFSTPTFTGGAAITQYTVTANPGGITATGTSAPITVTGLTNEVEYTFTVTATNSVGTSAASDVSDAITPDVDASEPPIMLFDFENNSQDGSGNDNHGVIVGNAVYTGSGHRGSALQLDGATYLTLPDDLLLNNQDFTVAFWFKTTSRGGLLGYQNTTAANLAAANEFVPILSVNEDGKLRAELWTDNGGLTLTSTPSVNDGEWHYVVMTGDTSGNKLSVYLDREFVGIGDATVLHLAMRYNQLGLSNGASREGLLSSDYFTGEIDELTFYQMALPAGDLLNNQAPIASSQNLAVTEDTATAATLGVTDADNNPLTYTIISNPTQGTLSGTAPNLTYTPAANYNGSDSFSFIANDGTVDSNSATVSITVNAVNDAPVAANDAATTAEDTAVVVSVLANDSDLDSSLDAASITVVTAPSQGATSINTTTGAVTYTPSANSHGSDSFTYTVSDVEGAASNTATVNLMITSVNDAPVLTGEAAVAVDEDGNYSFMPGFSDNDGDNLTFSVQNLPSWATFDPATGAITGTPANGDVGIARDIIVSVSDGTTTTTLPAFSIAVANTNDATVPVADSYSLGEGALLQTTASNGVLSNDEDVDSGDTLTATLATGPANSSNFTLNSDGSFSYRHNGTETRTDGFSYTVSDGTVTSSAVTVSLTIAAVNDAPRFVSTPPVSVVQGSRVSYSVGVNDPDSVTELALTQAPAWLTLNGNRLQGTAPFDTFGDVVVTLSASDESIDVVQSFTLQVIERGTPHIVLTTTWQGLPAIVGEEQTLNINLMQDHGPALAGGTLEVTLEGEAFTRRISDTRCSETSQGYSCPVALDSSSAQQLSITFAPEVEGNIVVALLVNETATGSLLAEAITDVSATDTSVSQGNVQFTLANATALATINLDDEGNKELIAGTSLDGTVKLLSYSKDEGTATVLGEINNTGATQAITVGDIDNDGLDDAVIVNSEGDASAVYYARGELDFSTEAASQVLPFGRAALLVDLNRDGFKDLIIGGKGFNLFIYPNIDGVFSQAPYVFNSPFEIAHFVIHNRKASDDAFAGRMSIATSDAVILLRFSLGANSAQFKVGSAAQSEQTLVAEEIDRFAIAGVSALRAADLNGDGEEELIMSTTHQNNSAVQSGVTIVSASEETGLNKVVGLGNASAKQVDLADFNGDGQVDLLVANDNDSYQFYIGGGTNEAWQLKDTIIFNPSTLVLPEDIDDDGLSDVLIYEDNTDEVNVYLSADGGNANITIGATADISVSATTTVMSNANYQWQYVASVHNNAAQSVNNIVLTIALPAGITVATKPTACTVNSAASVTCKVTSLAANSTEPFSLVLTASGKPSGNVVASVTSSALDANSANNKTTAAITPLFVNTAVQVEGGGKSGGAIGSSYYWLFGLLLLGRVTFARRLGLRAAAATLLTVFSFSASATEAPWYIELGLGKADSHWRSTELQSTFKANAQTITVTDLDDERGTQELLAGYRFHPNLAVELGYRDWGSISYNLSGVASNINAVTAAAQSHYPASGKGAFAGLRASYWHGDTLEGYAKISAWSWSGDYHILVNDQATAFSIDATDVVFSVGMNGYFFERYSAGVIYQTANLEGQRNVMVGAVVGVRF